MFEARKRYDWDQTASILVYLHNTHIADEDDAIDFEDVHPMHIRADRRPGVQVLPKEEAFALLKETFVDRPQGRRA